MGTKSDYGQREIEAAKSILIELMQILGEYRDQMVLIGGWVPFFLFGSAHVGSTDVDIALDREQITDDVYQTIRQHLEQRGYRQAEQPFIFTKEVKIDEGNPITVEVDFLAGEYGGTEKEHRHQVVQGNLKARKARGCELALEHHTQVSVEGKMPGGALNKVQLNLSEVVPFIVMKGMALHGRMKEKDAWDIYFCVSHFEGGIDGLAKEFESVLSNKLVQEGLSKIRAKFLSVDSLGPTNVTDFQEVSDPEERDRVKRDAFERVGALLDALHISEFKD
jgi:hypothetical protein